MCHIARLAVVVVADLIWVATLAEIWAVAVLAPNCLNNDRRWRADHSNVHRCHNDRKCRIGPVPTLE